MKVFAYPADNWGCGGYRVTWPAQAAAEADHSLDITVTPPELRPERPRYDPRTLEILEDGFPDDIDLAVFQRPTHFFHPKLIVKLRERGVAVVVDMDDDLAHIDGRNRAFDAMAPMVMHPETHKLPPVERNRAVKVPNANSFHHATEACRQATLVTVTTPLLAKVYGAHGRVRVLPNCVPASYLDIAHEDSDLLGWGGSMHSHPDDPQQVGPAVARLVGQGYRFETVGDPRGVARALGLREDPPSTGNVQLHEWAPQIARFGVGIAPLAPTRFNQAKSRLKPLEYNSVGVPCVVSPSEDYLAWAEVSGGCLVARKSREWEGTLRALLRDPARRLDMSAAGRSAAALHTIEGNAFKWLEAWHDAIRMQRGSYAACP